MKNLARIERDIEGTDYVFQIRESNGSLQLFMDSAHSAIFFENPKQGCFTTNGLKARDHVASSDLWRLIERPTGLWDRILTSRAEVNRYHERVLPNIAAFICSAVEATAELCRDKNGVPFLLVQLSGEDFTVYPGSCCYESLGSDVLYIFPLTHKSDELAEELIRYSLAVHIVNR